MSKYWGYVCRSHDPELVSEHWYNHGEQALTELYRKFHAEPWPVNEWGELEETEVHGQRTTAPVYWLNQHRNCNVALSNEYGDTQELRIDSIILTGDENGGVGLNCLDTKCDQGGKPLAYWPGCCGNPYDDVPTVQTFADLQRQVKVHRRVHHP